MHSLVQPHTPKQTIPEQHDLLLADRRLFHAQHGGRLLDALGAWGVPDVDVVT